VFIDCRSPTKNIGTVCVCHLLVEIPKGIATVSLAPWAIPSATLGLSSTLPAQLPVPQDLAKLLPNSAVNLTKAAHRKFVIHLGRQAM
jgi:hypothetical protein